MPSFEITRATPWRAGPEELVRVIAHYPRRPTPLAIHPWSVHGLAQMNFVLARKIATSAGLLAALLSLGSCTPMHSVVAPKVLMAVVSKGLPGVTIYDAATDQVICQSKMDVAPHEAAFSQDGRMLYVPIYSSANLGQPGPDGHAINFMRTSDCDIEASLDTGDSKRPHFVERGASGLLYVTAEMKQSILVVDPKKRSIVGTIPTGSSNTHFFAMTRDEKRIFTSNVSDGTLSVLDIPGRKLIATVEAGAANQRMTLSPDEKWFVTSLWQSGKVAFYRTADYQLDFTIDINGGPFVARFSPDGRFVYNMGNAPRDSQPAGIRVWKIDVATRKIVATSTEPLGVGTGSIQVNPVNGRVYLTAYSGHVVVLDPDTLQLVTQFSTAETPDGLFFSSQNKQRGVSL
jgi:DNA-binding beta-propeller fold protein YncE